MRVIIKISKGVASMTGSGGSCFAPEGIYKMNEKETL